MDESKHRAGGRMAHMGVANFFPRTAFFWFVKIKLATVARRILEMEAMEALKTWRPIENLASQRRNGALRESEEVG
jgi:hypothetical protein